MSHRPILARISVFDAGAILGVCGEIHRGLESLPGRSRAPRRAVSPGAPATKRNNEHESEELPCQLLDSLFNQRPTYRSIRPRTDPSPPSPFRLDSHEGPHRGGAGKGGWGKPGDELNAPKEGDEAEPEPEPEEPDNEISIEDFEAAKAAKKAAINAAMSKGAKAKEVDSSAFASMTLAAKNEDVNEFSLDGPGPKAKRERERKAAKEAAKIELGFKTAPSAPAEDRPARSGPGGRGGRGGRGDRREGGRGEGRGGGRGDRPAGGRGGAKIDTADTSAFPTLGGK